MELGRKLQALDLLEQPRDIFYLEVEEILGFIDGVASCTDLKGMVAVRRAEFDASGSRTGRPIGSRRTASFIRATTFREKPRRRKRAANSGTVWVVVRASSRGRCGSLPILRNVELRQGEILVAERTDPGWIMLFPSAAGLLVERGSLLSHSAIVAGELGLPAIVSVSGVTRWLKDGDEVEMDGGSGVVTRVPRGAE